MTKPSTTAAERYAAFEAWRALPGDERNFAIGALETEAESLETEAESLDVEAKVAHWTEEQRTDWGKGAVTCRIAIAALRALVDGKP